MWIKRGDTIINTDNVCAIRQEGDKLILRLLGSTAPSTIEHAPLSAEIVVKSIPEGTIEIIWQGILTKEKYLTLE